MYVVKDVGSWYRGLRDEDATRANHFLDDIDGAALRSFEFDHRIKFERHPLEQDD